MHRGCVATGERVCDVLSGPQLVPNWSSAHFVISKFPLNFSLQLRKAPRNIPMNHQSPCANLPNLVLPSKPQVSAEGLGREGGKG